MGLVIGDLLTVEIVMWLAAVGAREEVDICPHAAT